MLRSISWLQFTSFLFIGFLIYYGYFGWVYYRAGFRVFLRRQAVFDELNALAAAKQEPDVGTSSTAGASSTAEQKEVAKRLETDDNAAGVELKATGAESRPGTPDGKATGTEKGGSDADTGAKAKDKLNVGADARAKAAFQTKEMAIMHLKEVVDESVTAGLSWEGIKGRIQLVLAGCHALRGTEYQTMINSFIEQRCRASFALVLGEADLKRLWGVRGDGKSNEEEEQTQKNSQI